MPVFSSSKKKHDEYSCKIFALDAELQFTIETTAKAHTLFSLVCQTIGLREHWYFGIKFLNKATNEWTWLQMNRSIISQPLHVHPHSNSAKAPDSPSTGLMTNENLKPHLLRSPPTSPTASTLSLPSSVASGSHSSIKGHIELYFVVKFYPEDITQELIQDVTKHLFYLQVKQDILNMDIYCPPDTAAHLAALSLQAKFGDYDHLVSISDSLNLESEALLPLSCFQKVELSWSDWFARIVSLWRTHASLTREEAEMAYLKNAQDLDMFGLSFFEISKMQGVNKSNGQSSSDQPSITADLWLGIDSLGIRFYKKNKLRPEVFFAWSDIKSVTAHDKKVVLNMNGEKNATFAFYAAKSSVSREILDLATGNHELYMRRRREQPIEIQQMKFFEEQQQKEKLRIVARERQIRLQAEQERNESQQKCLEYQQQIKQIHDTLLKYQEAAELLARKAHISSEEARLQSEKALEIEAQLERCKFEISRNEEEKRLFSRQINECEQVISTLVNDSLKQRKEAEELKSEVKKWRLAEAAAREKLLSITQLNQTVALANAAAHAQHNLAQSSTHSTNSTRTLSPPPYRPVPRNTDVNANEDRAFFIDKQTQLALQLQDLKNVIQSKKIEDRQTPLDKAYEESLAVGDNKYSTIQKARSGTALKRMAMLQDL